ACSRRRFLFFFFQAEDGIRDGHVTGVQTCALPIWLSILSGEAICLPVGGSASSPPWRWRAAGPEHPRVARLNKRRHNRLRDPPISEERRVGKECRSRWAADP